jgi:hypothetical protein
MQLIDSKLYNANMPAFRAAGGPSVIDALTERGYQGVGRRYGRCRAGDGLTSRLKGTRAAERVLALLLGAFILTASPALLATVRSAVSLALQILLQAGHFGLIAFQILGR